MLIVNVSWAGYLIGRLGAHLSIEECQNLSPKYLLSKNADRPAAAIISASLAAAPPHGQHPAEGA